jgi:hypothetical protein
MASAPDLKLVNKVKTDDAIREAHGCLAAQADACHRREVLLREERDDLVYISVGSEKARLTPWQARYLASKLYRLSRRIRQRTEQVPA